MFKLNVTNTFIRTLNLCWVASVRKGEYFKE